eukprot:gb/GEZN01011384.1/.p1 GENE.gb/GEZN01011384.1/~~gb/GEZN01011384.1/.p1  ORF type:complete len:285 (-),score=7.48 gb/GEZN01011384.1/:235-1089(-)
MADGTDAAWKSFLAGSVAGMASIVVVHPLDTIRTRVQTSSKYYGAWDCAVETARREGMRGFYKGLSLPLCFQAIYKSVMFGSFTQAKKLLHDFSSDAPPSIGVIGASAAIAGGVNSFVVTPVELVRNRLMVQYDSTGLARQGPLVIIREVLGSQGMSGMFKGLGATLARDMPGVGAWFYANEKILRYFRKELGTSDVGPARTLFAGALGGVSFWMWALPVDTIKSRIQTDTEGRYKSFVGCVMDTYREGGIARFYRGGSVAYARGIPASAITFFVYGQTVSFLK